MKTKISIFAALAIAALATLSACGSSTTAPAGHRVAALDDTAWNESVWISVVDAPVVTGRIKDGSRSADGASWFLSTVKNEGKVTAATWMTTGLGVYDLFLNGQLVGKEVLKPGFTHFAKTKRSFTYDITDAFLKKAGEEKWVPIDIVK